MSFTINKTFDLLFAADAASTDATSYEERRWFRRPSPAVGVAELPNNPDVDAADTLLAGRIKTSMPKWSSVAGVSPAVQLDAKRHIPPRMPYDVFAFSAHLMEQAGIYHHLQPLKTAFAAGGSPLTASTTLRHIDITHADLSLVSAAAKAWVGLTGPPGSMVDLAKRLNKSKAWDALEPLFESWWVLMAAFSDRLVLERPSSGSGVAVPVWWKHAWRLLAIADEAASSTGYQFDVQEMRRFADGEQTDIRWFEFEVLLEHVQRALSLANVTGATVASREFRDINTLSVANPAVVNVLPKVRTPSVGCTLRSLSHHLALLPPTGVVKGRWTPNYIRPRPPGGSMPTGVMNLVLVPLPYSLGARSFIPTLIEDVSGGVPGEVPRFGYFDVRQDWIEGVDHKKLTNFIDAIIKSAREQSPTIHGFILPELALDYDTYQVVREHIRQRLPETEIFVSGISSNDKGEKGNFVAASTFSGDPTAKLDELRETVREKHHRWKLDRSQLSDYGLLGALSPELGWWENIALQSRQVDFTVMRRDSVLAAMICEDLARVDPCQQMIRAVGPNLVVALLMDAPQVAARWPARYATVLAEDPGCAVLTLTSRGLMTLQHRVGTYRSNGQDRIVAMWRDDGATRPIELNCPYDAQALLLTIVEQPVEDVALDGRRDGGAKAWRYVGNVPLRIPDREAHREILGPEDLACR